MKKEQISELLLEKKEVLCGKDRKEFIQKENERLRKEAPMGYFEVLTGKKMTEAQLLLYWELFEKAKKEHRIYNIADFAKDFEGRDKTP